jgi:O-antigen/teichoic acid export membrane protein
MYLIDQNLKSTVVSSLFWKLMERGGTQGIQFIIQIILARLLMPEDYGVIVIISVFISIATVFVQTGISTSLIQKKNVDEIDLSSSLLISIIIALIMYFILFIFAPIIATFYNMHVLKIVLRILSLTLFFGAINSIQIAIISRKMLFKKLFFSSLGSIIISGTVGIFLAFYGFGIWALVIQQLINQFTITMILWFTLKWRPQYKFSLVRIKELFNFGWKILASSLIDTFYNNLRSLIIGKIYDSKQLGYYNRGQQFPSLIVTNLNGSIQSVMLPALSSKQEDLIVIKGMVRRSIKISSYLVFPAMIGLAVIAEPMVKVLLTDKWLPAVPFLQIYCLSYSLWPIHTANLQAINALGKSEIFLKLEIIKKVIGFVILFTSLYFGLYAIALGSIVSGLVSAFINAYPNKKLFNYSIKEQIKDIYPPFLLSIFIGAICYLLSFLNINLTLLLAVQILFGLII